MRRALLIVFITISVVGCGDAETKGNVATNAGNTDMGTSEPDMGTSEPDAGTELFGTVCAGPGGELVGQECSVVDQDCEIGVCEKRIILDDMQMPTGFAVICSSDETEATLVEGDVCGVGIGECRTNMVCKRFAGEAESFCRRWCRIEDAYGCDPAQACVPSSDLEPVFGVCADECPE
jgi:hypothetical protein